MLMRLPVGVYCIVPWLAFCNTNRTCSVIESPPAVRDFDSNSAALLQSAYSMQSGKHIGNAEYTSEDHSIQTSKHISITHLEGKPGWFLKGHNRSRIIAVSVITIVAGLVIFAAMFCRRKREDWSGSDADSASVKTQSATQTPRTPGETPREKTARALRSRDDSPRSHALTNADTNATGIFKVFGRDVVVDEHEADYVLILPLRQGQESTHFKIAGARVHVLHWDEVVDGLTLARALFQDSYRNQIISEEELSMRFQNEMNQETYILTIRQVIMDLLVGPHFGLAVTVTPSADKDELLLRLSIPENNSTLEQYAANAGYKMPLSDAAYTRIGNKITQDVFGTEMRAVTEFEPKHPECFQRFTKLDRLVLLRARLDKFLDLDALLRQHVISGHFPLHDYRQVHAMCRSWANPWKWFMLPTHDADHSVRNYFGEEIAWMFVWQTYFTKALLLPAALGAGVYYCRFFLTLTSQHKLQMGYAVFMGLWCTWFNAYYDRKESRLRYTWGMNDFTPLASVLNRYDYKPQLDGSWRVNMAPALGDLLVLLFVGLSVVGMHAIQEFRQRMVDKKAHWMWVQSAALLITMQIIVLDKCWRLASKFIANLENHRSEAKWLESWVAKMFPVRLFFNLYPFLYIGFMKQYTKEGCPRIQDGCLHELETDLITYFILRVVAEFGLDLMFLIWVRLQIIAEMKRKESQGSTLIYAEVQSKAWDYGPVMLMDDWTDQVMTFAFVACFSVILPAISFIALLTNLIETRAVAYRNACFLRRPLPIGANGIGAWRNMLLLIEIIAVMVNFGFAVFVMSPLKTEETSWKVVVFLVGEHLVLLAKFVLHSKFPRIPRDISNLAYQQQQDIKRTFVDLEHHRVQADVITKPVPDVGPRADC